jgi:hypothetical protein
MEFGYQNQLGRVIYPAFCSFTCSKKKYTYGGQKGENKPPEETEFGGQNQYCCVSNPSIGNFTWIKKIYTFRGQKSKNKPSSPKSELNSQKIKNNLPP